MKKYRFCAFTIILTVLILCFSGCMKAETAPTQAPVSASPEQSVLPATESPAVSPTQFPAESPLVSSREIPVDELVQPGYDVQTSILWDLNGDGARETISVGLGDESEIGNDILLSVSENGEFNTVTVGSGYFETADYLQTPIGTPCVVVSYSYEDQYSTTTLITFDGLKPVLQGSVEGSASGISGNGFAVNYWLDVLGTWPCFGYYCVSDDYSLEPQFDPYIQSADLAPLVTKAPVKAEIWKDGDYIKVTLDAGTSLTLYQTDGKTYMKFWLRDYYEQGDYVEGTMYFTKTGNEYFIDGVSEYDCFVNVPYAN